MLNTIFLIKWYRGEKLDAGISMSMMAMLFYIFISVNAMTFWAMQIFSEFLSCVRRISQIFKMEEFVFARNIHVEDKNDVHLIFENADIGWGFRKKDKSLEDKKADRGMIQLEEVKEPTI